MAIIQTRDVRLPDGQEAKRRVIMSAGVKTRAFDPKLPTDPDVLSKARQTNSGKGGRMFSTDLRDITAKKAMQAAQAEKRATQAPEKINTAKISSDAPGNKKGGARAGAGRPKKK
jgi:hypothetical protein